jgi:hypothetical protein
MRVAAGVILILVAIIDLFAGIGYVTIGAVAANADKVEKAVERRMREKGKSFTTDERRSLDKFDTTEKTKVEKAGGGLLLFGVFLLVTVGTSIAAAVLLFMQRRPAFIIVAGSMAILGEVIGILLIKFGVSNVFGLVGGLFAIIAATGIMNANRVPPTAGATG